MAARVLVFPVPANPWKSVYAVGTGQHLADGRLLRLVQKLAGRGLPLCGGCGQHWSRCALSVKDMLHVCSLVGNRLRCCEAAAGSIFLTLDETELAFGLSPPELTLHVGKADLTHPTT